MLHRSGSDDGGGGGPIARGRELKRVRVFVILFEEMAKGVYQRGSS